MGPGSWTGIRVGVTVAKILAYSTGKPICGISTLQALAYSAHDELSLICPVISAGTMDTVYAAFYRAINGSVSQVGEYYVGDIKGLAEMLKEPAVLVGSEICSYGALASMDIKVVEAVPNGANVATLAEGYLEQGESVDALSLTPLYLKESTARAYMSRYARNA